MAVLDASTTYLPPLSRTESTGAVWVTPEQVTFDPTDLPCDLCGATPAWSVDLAAMNECAACIATQGPDQGYWCPLP